MKLFLVAACTGSEHTMTVHASLVMANTIMEAENQIVEEFGFPPEDVCVSCYPVAISVLKSVINEVELANKCESNKKEKR